MKSNPAADIAVSARGDSGPGAPPNLAGAAPVMIPAAGLLANRAVPEWVGKTADTAIPDRVKLRVALRASNKDALTGEKLRKGWHLDHIIGLRDWVPTTAAPHGNRETNLQPLNADVNLRKEARERKVRAKIMRIQSKAIGIEKPKAGFQSRPFWSKPKPVEKYDRMGKNHKAHKERMAEK
jgi:hypothetical protein